jgi:hypothetical protein
VGIKRRSRDRFVLREHKQDTAYPLEGASIGVGEPLDYRFDQIPEGRAALHIDVTTRPLPADEHHRAPHLSIGPIFVDLDRLEDLGGRRFELDSGYDESIEDHVATLYVFEHQTLGKTSISIGPVRNGKARLSIEAVTEDTNYYDSRARAGRLTIDAMAAVRGKVPATQPARAPRPSKLRVAPNPKKMIVWVGEYVRIRDCDRYLREHQDDRGTRSKFIAECGLWSTPGDSLKSYCAHGSWDIDRIFEDIVVYGEKDVVRAGVRAAKKAGIELANTWILLSGYELTDVPWPRRSPVQPLGTFRNTWAD